LPVAREGVRCALIPALLLALAFVMYSPAANAAQGPRPLPALDDGIIFGRLKTGKLIGVFERKGAGGGPEIMARYSADNGASWQAATLGPDLGRFAFRAWTYRFTPNTPGKHTIVAKATNVIGQTQAESLILNPAGYHNNVVRPLTIVAA